MCFVTVSAPKRFYKNSNVLYNGNSQYEVTLDNKKLRTPNGGAFVVRSEPLAIAVAAEWNAQKENIERSTMHLVGMFFSVKMMNVKVSTFSIDRPPYAAHQ